MVRRFSLLIMVTMAVATCTALAGQGEYSRIARISYLEGHVSFQHPNEVDWSAASINMALQPADRIYSGDDGRAEIQFDDGSVLRLAEKTDVEILSLREDLIQLRVLVGLCSLTVHNNVSFEVDTPAAAYNTLKKGAYRFDVTEDGTTDAIVRKGLLEASNNKYSQRVDSGELAHIAPGGQGIAQLSSYGQRDAWDEWTDRRDADVMAYDSRRYIPDNVSMGVSELDQYGHWVVVDSYGPAWVPYYVDAGWSPYWVGRWCYRPYWGWTWVSYEPWGWLPYHYGRWYYAGFGWCWLPGPSFGFDFWSPGLVRFYSGPSWISWCPLGPGDYYNVSHYWYNPAFHNRINDIRLIQNRAPGDLVNRNVAGAFRTVPTSTFASSSLGGVDRAPVIENIDQPWRRGHLITDRLPVQPGTSSFAPVPGRPAVRPTTIQTPPTIVRTMPSAAGISRDHLVRITNPAVTATSFSGKGEAGNVTGAERSASPGGSPATSIWNRQTSGNDRGNAGNGRVSQTPVHPAAGGPRNSSNSREVPGNTSRRVENPSKGRETAPPARQRMETAPPNRMQSIPAPAPQPRNQEQSRPSSRPKSSSNESGSGWQYLYDTSAAAENRTSVGQYNESTASAQRSPQEARNPRSDSSSYEPQSGSGQQSGGNLRNGDQGAVGRPSQVGRGYEPPAPRPMSVPSVGGGASWNTYSAPAGRSYSPSGWSGGSLGSAPGSARSMSAPSVPSGGAGIARSRGR